MLACATPTTKASRHQAVTSSVAAQPRAMIPNRVCCIRRSVKMRANTGNAVIEVATPMNRAKLVNDTALLESRGYRISARAAPNTNGTTMLA